MGKWRKDSIAFITNKFVVEIAINTLFWVSYQPSFIDFSLNSTPPQT